MTLTAYATHLHKHISRDGGVLNALDLTGNTQRERVITVATSPAIGALIMPVITKKLRSVFSPDFAAQRRHYRRGQPVKPASG